MAKGSKMMFGKGSSSKPAKGKPMGMAMSKSSGKGRKGC